MGVDGRTPERVHAEIVSDEVDAPTPARPGGVARIQAQVGINRIGTIQQLTAAASQGIVAAYGIAGEWSDAGIRRLERHDSLMDRLGEAAAAEHRVAKDNLRRRLQQVAELAASAVQETYRRDVEEAMCLPDAAFYAPSLGEQLTAALWDGTSIELERRNLGRLTPGEWCKEILVGGVIDAKITAHDQRQVAERRERLDLVKQLDAAQAQLAALAARTAELEALSAGAQPVALATGERSAEPSDEERRERLAALRALLDQVAEAQPEPVPGGGQGGFFDKVREALDVE